jgi:REP element-mobilizing transposase RayT
MNYNPEIHHRRSIRLKGYDYSSQGVYFITFCVQGRANLLGHIDNGELYLSDAGKMIEKWYDEIPNKFPNVECGEMVIMPNHFHCIWNFINQQDGITIPKVVQWFKTMTTNEYIRGVKELGWQPFDKRLWQRNYYEHIIRNEQAYENISNYIKTNPERWQSIYIENGISSSS